MITNLPAELSSFIGREHDVAKVRRLLAGTRLLTLTGPGGVGKTRLALRLAAEVRQSYAHGAWFVGLAPLGDAGLVAQAVTAVFGLIAESGRPTQDRLAEYLSSRHVLLILDNCEHLLAGCAELAAGLLAACPSLSVLATSRESLGVPGETAWLVPSLAVPAGEPTFDAIAGCESVRLFVDRARSVQPGFHLTDANCATVAEICERLDGIPLAIELAAATTRAFTAEQIVRLLDRRFEFLGRPGRGLVPRQATLRALVDWSHDLLSEEERILLRRLSVFAGGWSPEAAEAVCAGPPLSGSVLSLLVHLVEKSLVIAGERESAMRYRVLETIRQYAGEKLREAGEVDALRLAHARWFLAWAERHPTDTVGLEQSAWTEAMELEHDNLRTAMDWCKTDDVLLGLRLAGALRLFWSRSGRAGEGRMYVGELLARSDTGEQAGDTRARASARAAALLTAGHLAMRQGSCDAAELLQASADLSRQLGDERGAMTALCYRGRLARQLGDLSAARQLLTDALTEARQLKDAWATQSALSSLGHVLQDLGDVAAARTTYQEALVLARQKHDDWYIPLVLCQLALISIDADELAAARAMLAEAVTVHRQSGFRTNVIRLLHAGAILAAAERRPTDTLRLAGAASILTDRYGDITFETAASFTRHVATARAELTEEAADAALADGATLTLDDALEFVVSGASGPEDTYASKGKHWVLTRREREVVVLVARGMTNREIAEAIVVSEGTAKKHVENILGKLAMSSRAEVAAWAAQNGFLGA